MLGFEAVADTHALEALLGALRLVTVQIFSFRHGRRPTDERRLLETVGGLELREGRLEGEVAVDAIPHILLACLLHTLIVLMSVLVGTASGKLGVCCLWTWPGLVPVLVRSIEV